MRTIPTVLSLTSLCDPPLRFVYLQVNTDVSYCLDCVDDIPVSILNPNHLPSTVCIYQAGRPGSSEVIMYPSGTSGREFDPGKRDFSH